MTLAWLYTRDKWGNVLQVSRWAKTKPVERNYSRWLQLSQNLKQQERHGNRKKEKKILKLGWNRDKQNYRIYRLHCQNYEFDFMNYYDYEIHIMTHWWNSIFKRWKNSDIWKRQAVVTVPLNRLTSIYCVLKSSWRQWHSVLMTCSVILPLKPNWCFVH